MVTRLLLSLLAIAVFAPVMQAQQLRNTVTRIFSGVPSGACAPFHLAKDSTTGDFYSCDPGTLTWVLIGPGAGGGITTLNTLTADPQLFATGTAGTDFAISSVTATHTFNLPTASAANRGALSTADWTTFNSKAQTGSPAACTNQFITDFALTSSGAPTSTCVTITTVALASFEGTCQDTTAGFSFDTPSTNAPAAACITGTQVENRASLDFDDTTQENVYGSIWLPDTWTSTVDVDVEWFGAATANDVIWGVQTGCVADGVAYDPAWNTDSTVTDTAKGTTNQRNLASMTTVDVTGCLADSRMFFNFYRKAADGSDDFSGDARLVAVRFKTRKTIP